MEPWWSLAKTLVEPSRNLLAAQDGSAEEKVRWSLVTLPTSLGRVASDYFVVFSWPCSHENKARQISLFVVACDPTYFWGRVASDYFLALPTPPLVA